MTHVLHAAAVTSNVARERTESGLVVGVNLGGLAAVAAASAALGVERFVFVSSNAVFGGNTPDYEMLDEDWPKDPGNLYALSKWTGEMILDKIGAATGLDWVAGRLAGVFGPWEYRTGLRDTMNPVFQANGLALAGRPAFLPRPGRSNWHFSRDAAASLVTLLTAPSHRHRLYNLGTPFVWSIGDWCERLAGRFPEFRFTIGGARGDATEIDLYGSYDGGILSWQRFTEEFGPTGLSDLDAAFDELMDWHAAHQAFGLGGLRHEAPLYRGYDQDGLDRQYERLVADDSYAIFDRWRARSDASAASRPATLDIAYGPRRRRRSTSSRPPAPTRRSSIYIHGGYWIWKDKADFRFVAEGVVDQGATLVVINYALTPGPRHGRDRAPGARGDSLHLDRMPAASFPADRDRLFLAGHSAGGHLAAIAAATDWPAFDPALPAEIVAGAFCVSGLYDLEPIRLCYLNETVGLDAAMALRNSPLHAVRPAMPPLTLAVGGAESDEFKRQQATFAEALAAAGNSVETAEIAGLHHFAVIETIAALRQRAQPRAAPPDGDRHPRALSS